MTVMINLMPRLVAVAHSAEARRTLGTGPANAPDAALSLLHKGSLALRVIASSG